MRITEIRVTPRSGGSFKGIASITLEDCFVIRGLKIIEERSGRLFVAMPCRRKRDGSFQDVAHPITPAFRKQLELAVLGKYNRVLESGFRDATGFDDEPGGDDL